MKKKLFSAVALLMVCCMVLGACGSSQSSSGSTDSTAAGATESGSEGSEESSAVTTTKDTITIALAEDPGKLDVDTLTGNPYLGLFDMVGECLMQLSSDGEYEPALMESWELDEDGMGVTAYLRQGVLFHNGNEMTAEIVQKDILYVSTTGTYSSTFSYIDAENIEVIDTYTLHIPFNEVSGGWMTGMVGWYVFDYDAYEEQGDTFWQAPVTTSPYYVSDWVSGDSITMTAFEDYWNGTPVIQTLVFRVISETSVALMELSTGGVDVVFNLNNEDAFSIDSSDGSGVEMYEVSGNTEIYVGMNNSKEALSDIRVRQAIAYAVDRDTILAGPFNGGAELMYSIIGSHAFGYVDTYEEENWPYQYDPDKAKELLEEAGYADGLTLSIVVDSTPVRRLIAEQMNNMLAEVGITLDIQQVDFATAGDILNNTNDYDLYIRGATVCTGDAYAGLINDAVFGLCKMTEVDGYDEYKELLDTLSQTLDEEGRKEVYAQVQDYFISSGMYWLPIATQTIYVLANDSLQNLEITNGYLHYENSYFN
ncbi:MAG: ABC transporter substrate-binding protein [Lachnospiraceae bacterium]|nr:ABC transporter substrate-binding protein [Lachnospiraceae bacterium]MCD8010793.1 ABC transporter substrate-binding protein [Lachnospiraceae bacterium]